MDAVKSKAPIKWALDVHRRMTPKKKTFLAISLVVLLLIGILQLMVSSLFSSGPSPRQIFVVSSEDYEINQILEALDTLAPKLGNKINKNEHANSYALYTKAYWYPMNSSSVYGVSIVEWSSSFLPKGENDRKGKYFIDIYSNSRKCDVCNLVGQAFLKNKITSSLLCKKQGLLTAYAKERCDI